MKNALIFYYDIYLNEVIKKENNYYFTYSTFDFVVEEYNRDLEEIESLYMLNQELLELGIDTYKIILTKENNLLFFYEEHYYILMKIPKIENRIITYEDILKFNIIPSNNLVNKIDKSSWSYFWENKIDYFEYQFQQMEKRYRMLHESIHYYIGIWENAISYFNDNVGKNKEKVVCHKRVSFDMDYLTFLNPMNLVLDYKERDIGEYIKSYIYENRFSKEKLNYFFSYNKNDRNSALLLITRLLFPSNYFDLYEEITVNNKDESFILDIIAKRNNYEFLLNSVFEYYYYLNIPQIDWIIKKTD